MTRQPYVSRLFPKHKGLFFLIVMLLLLSLMLPPKTSYSQASSPEQGSGDASAAAANAVVAFPGAEGFGAKSVGGRGGKVMEVTNLNDSGPGSLRSCVEASGPRICVFRVGGTITTETEIIAKNPYLTIAGQTAPGGGITVRAAQGYHEEPFIVSTHDVIIRHMRFRAGASSVPNSSRRSFTLNSGSYNVIIDHSSFSWATDQPLLLIDGVHDITIQWSIISEGLAASTHYEDDFESHSKGLSVSGKNYKSTEKTGNITIHHNLIAHNDQRNPQNAGYGLEDVVNNVIYNWGVQGFNAADTQANVPSNVIANYFKAGVNTTGWEVNATHNNDAMTGPQVYIQGNIGPHRPDESKPEIDLVKPQGRSYIVNTRFPAPPVTTTSAQQAYLDVLANAGARVPMMDAVDRRVIEEVKHGEGKIIDCVSANELRSPIDCSTRVHLTSADYTKYGINDPLDAQGWPIFDAGTPPQDSDQDGMPDSWETQHGLNPNTDDSAQDRNGDGYTNIEEYINGLAGGAVTPVEPEPTAPPVPSATPTSAPSATATPAPSATSTPQPTAPPTVSPTPPPAVTPGPGGTGGKGDVIFVSSTSKGKINNITFADEDVLAFDSSTKQWTLYFDGSDVLPTDPDLDAFVLMPDNSILISLNNPAEVSPLGLVDDSDIIRFIPTSIGSNTAGTFEWYFDGSDVELDADGEDIDAISVMQDGRLIISTVGVVKAGGLSRIQDEDLLTFQPTTLGETTSGTWSLFFDGSVAQLDTAKSEDINGSWIEPTTGHRYLTTIGNFSVPGLNGDGADIFVCVPNASNPNECTFSMYWDGAAYGFGSEVIDALYIDRGGLQVTSEFLASLGSTEHDGAGDDTSANPDEGADDVPEDVPDEGVQQEQLLLPFVQR